MNGVTTRLAYANGQLAVLPRTADGQVTPAVRPRLVSMRTADLDAETFAYSGNYLSATRRGGHAETFEVQGETLAERRQNILAAKSGSKVKPSGKVAGRLLADGSFAYSYGEKPGDVTLTDRAGRTARYAFSEKTGVFDITEFTGRKYTIYYFMRYDVAYLGKVRKVVDGRGRDVVSYRYDRMTGRPTRVRDRLGNDVNLEWDAEGRLVRETRRLAGASAEEPVRAVARDKAGNPASVSILDADGKAVRAVSAKYDGERRPVQVSDGRRAAKIAYAKHGRPVSVTDAFGRTTSFAYDAWNRPVSATDADGVVTTCAYTDFGAVAKMERRAGDELVQSVEIAYDGAGRPVSYTDQDGLVRKYERDAFGRVAKEIFPDASEVAYSYDGAGRLESVLDENRHEIKFGWDAAGLASRATAVGQLTDYVRDDYGLLKEVVSSKDGKADRKIKREYDRFDRVTKIAYGPGEVETFAYDARGRLAMHTRGSKAETYSYDYFGRMAEKSEDGVTTMYAYDAWGMRTGRRTTDKDGTIISEETRTYDKFGRLSEIKSDGKVVRYEYGKNGRISRQTVDGRIIAFAYTKYGRLASKTLLGADSPLAELKYWYSKSGKMEMRLANGRLQKYAYDRRGQLVQVSGEDGKVLEKYAYDAAGNILEKTAFGKTTTYRYDAANQLVSSKDADGKVTEYAYDAAGRMTREGAKVYRYGYLDKVLAVAEGKERRTFTYHVDGQLATATRTGGTRSVAAETEKFLWDGLALIRRGSTAYVNEPHPGGGAAVASSRDGVMFNDILGTTLGTEGADGYVPVELSAFGDTPPSHLPTSSPSHHLFTGKPSVDGLGYAFLFRNYRARLGKWQTADPLGYPDGWNQMAYGVNSPIVGFDSTGGSWDNVDMLAYYYRYGLDPIIAIYGQIVSWIGTYDSIDTDFMDLTSGIWGRIESYNVMSNIRNQISLKLIALIYNSWRSMSSSGSDSSSYRTSRSYDFSPIVWSLGYGLVTSMSDIYYTWSIYENNGHYYCSLAWSSLTNIYYKDDFRDPTDTEHWLGISIEAGGVPYEYSHTWNRTLDDHFTFMLLE